MGLSKYGQENSDSIVFRMYNTAIIFNSPLLVLINAPSIAIYTHLKQEDMESNEENLYFLGSWNNRLISFIATVSQNLL